jgi:hypothetical protein
LTAITPARSLEYPQYQQAAAKQAFDEIHNINHLKDERRATAAYSPKVESSPIMAGLGPSL